MADAHAISDELSGVVGSAHVLADPDVVAAYGRDWTGRFIGSPSLVVRPENTAEVAAVVAICRRERIALVPQGGNTGLVGGSVPRNREVVLSLRRLDLCTIDADSGQASVGAGVTLAQLRNAAAAAGWHYGVDIASRDTATLGGTIATNAGGLRVARYGDTRGQVIGIEAVLGDGSIVSHLHGLLRDNTGYHLPSLLCGSEGTLGVVTAARLRLWQPMTERVVALAMFVSTADALAAARRVRRDVSSFEAVEFFRESGLDLVCMVDDLPLPFAAAPVDHAYLLVECAANHDPAPELERAIGSIAGLIDIAVATDAARRNDLWAYRERHTTAISTVGVPHKLDVCLPFDRLAEFAQRVDGAVAASYPHARVWLFGHAADGNLHVNVTGVDPGDDGVDDLVLALTTELDGSISAEHGIGVAKMRWLDRSRSAAELAAFAAIKSALDPDGILNPGVIVPAL